MAHQNTSSSTATAQNAATNPGAPNDHAHGRGEPKSYVAEDVADASVAAPAAGEIADAMDEGDALDADDVQQGSARADRPGGEAENAGQGPKTLDANRDRLKGQ
jgi:hypothetical protein